MVSENNAKVIIKQGINIKLIALLMTIFIVWLIVLRPIFNIDLVHYENSNLGEKVFLLVKFIRVMHLFSR